MIQRFSMQALAAWNRGELKVEIRRPGSERPIAYCDGTDDDLKVKELQAIAEGEGEEMPTIHRRLLKTGREIWTLGDYVPPDDVED